MPAKASDNWGKLMCHVERSETSSYFNDYGSGLPVKASENFGA
jgi:hypothetical protein